MGVDSIKWHSSPERAVSDVYNNVDYSAERATKSNEYNSLNMGITKNDLDGLDEEFLELKKLSEEQIAMGMDILNSLDILLDDEQQMEEEQQRIEQERMKEEQQRIEQERMKEEQQRIEQERMKEEQQRIEQERMKEEQQRIEQERIQDEQQNYVQKSVDSHSNQSFETDEILEISEYDNSSLIVTSKLKNGELVTGIIDKMPKQEDIETLLHILEHQNIEFQKSTTSGNIAGAQTYVQFYDELYRELSVCYRVNEWMKVMNVVNSNVDQNLQNLVNSANYIMENKLEQNAQLKDFWSRKSTIKMLDGQTYAYSTNRADDTSRLNSFYSDEYYEKSLSPEVTSYMFGSEERRKQLFESGLNAKNKIKRALANGETNISHELFMESIYGYSARKLCQDISMEYENQFNK